jgi:type VI secretion system protein ImpL
MTTNSLFWLVFLAVVVLLLLGLAIAAAIRRGARPDKPALHSTAQINSVFSEFTQVVDSSLGPSRTRYDLPLAVVLSEGEQPDPAGLSESALAFATGIAGNATSQLEGPVMKVFDEGALFAFATDRLADPTKTIDQRRWTTFLNLAGQYRPQRPFDSVIVNIPVSLLLQADQPEGISEIERRATATSRRLWHAQNHFGIRYPVYLLVSGLEDLEGFSSLQLLSDEMRDGLLGWSSPFDPTKRYSSSWVEQAVEQTTESLSHLATELTTTDRSPSARATLTFPAQLNLLARGLRIYADLLNGAATFHEPFFFRGVYFSGKHERAVFVKDLLKRKVFAEYGLSRAALAFAVSRPITSRVLRWGAISLLTVWLLGLIITSYQLQRIFPGIAEGIEGLNRDAMLRDVTRPIENEDATEWRAQTAASFIMGLENIRANRLIKPKPGSDDVVINPFMPGSWPYWDPLLTDLKDRIEREFAEVVVPTVRQVIIEKGEKLTGVSSLDLLNTSNNQFTEMVSCRPDERSRLDFNGQSERRPINQTLAINAMEHYQRLARFINEAASLNNALNAYQSVDVPSNKAEDDLRYLLRYTLGQPFEQPLTASLSLFHSALDDKKKHLFEPAFQAALRCSTNTLYSSLLNQLVEDNPIIKSEKKIAEIQGQLLEIEPTRDNFSQRFDLAETLLELLDDQKALLAGGANQWMAGPVPDLLTELRPLLQSIEKVSGLGPDFVQKSLIPKTQQASLSLSALRSNLGGPDKDSGLRISTEQRLLITQSEDRTEFVKALTKLLDSSAYPYNAPLANKFHWPSSLRWDEALLSEAIETLQTRLIRINDELKNIPEVSRDVFRTLAYEALGAHIQNLITKAVGEDPDETPLGSEDFLKSYKSTHGKLSTLLTGLEKISLKKVAGEIRQALDQDALLRLEELKSIFHQNDPYRLIHLEPNRTESLDKSLAFDPIGLQTYLQQQFKIIQQINETGKVLLQGLSLAHYDPFWSMLDSNVTRQISGNPTATIKRLEGLLYSFTSEEFGVFCKDGLSKQSPAVRSTDYFEARFAELHGALRQLCRDRNANRFIAEWEAFTNSLNNYLGRYRPLVSLGLNSTNTSGNRYPVIDRTLMSNLLKDPGPSLSAGQLTALGLPSKKKEELLEFAERWAKTRSALQQIFPLDPIKPAGAKFQAVFRDSRNQELAANQILDWSIQVGGKTATERNARTTALIWRPGEPIVIQFRFADQSNLLPVSEPSDPSFQVTGRSVRLTLDGPLALLDLIQRYKVSPVDGQTDRALLKLEVPVRLSSEPSGQASRRVISFLGLSLTSLQDDSVVNWPLEIPVRAPSLKGFCTDAAGGLSPCSQKP